MSSVWIFVRTSVDGLAKPGDWLAAAENFYAKYFDSNRWAVLFSILIYTHRWESHWRGRIEPEAGEECAQVCWVWQWE